MEQIMTKIPHFMIVFLRIGAFIAFVPFFNNPNFVMMMKVAFAFFISLLIFPAISTASWVIPGDIPGYVYMMTMEIMVGILMGLVFLILLFALQVAGRMLGFQMAFSMANVVDVTFGDNANVLSVFMVVLGTMLIVSLGGDHYLLYTINRSFKVLTPGTLVVTKPLLSELSRLVVHAFEIGFKLSAPAVILMLCIDLTLGLIGKTASKMQIFFVGLPLKIALGLFGFSLILGFIVSIWAKDIPKLPDIILGLFRDMKL
jgi:flagellar biosynthetic protein FliR